MKRRMSKTIPKINQMRLMIRNRNQMMKEIQMTIPMLEIKLMMLRRKIRKKINLMILKKMIQKKMIMKKKNFQLRKRTL